MTKKKKIKIWGKIKLFETSAVGIAAYPDAHLSMNEFSLVKALSELDEELNIGENTKMVEEPEKEIVESPQEPAQEEPKPEPAKEEPKPEEPEAEKSKPITLEDIQKTVADGMEKALKNAGTERGLVLTEKEVREELKTKSMGELAIGCGLFTPK